MSWALRQMAAQCLRAKKTNSLFRKKYCLSTTRQFPYNRLRAKNENEHRRPIMDLSRIFWACPPLLISRLFLGRDGA